MIILLLALISITITLLWARRAAKSSSRFFKLIAGLLCLTTALVLIHWSLARPTFPANTFLSILRLSICAFVLACLFTLVTSLSVRLAQRLITRRKGLIRTT